LYIWAHPPYIAVGISRARPPGDAAGSEISKIQDKEQKVIPDTRHFEVRKKRRKLGSKSQKLFTVCRTDA
jgi:hypothetical protein